MLRALYLTFEQIGDRAVVGVLAKSLAITLLIFVLCGWGMVWSGRQLARSYGLNQDAGLVTALAVFGAIAAAWLLFRAVAVPVMGFFADEVVAAIERRHYPAAAIEARPVSFGRSLAMGVRSLGRVVLVNLIAVPVYVLLLVTGVGPVILFVGLNAVLLGRDLGEMVAARHLDSAALKAWLGATRGQRAFAGLIVTGLFTIPVVNLLAPVIGAGLVTHLFHGRRV
jgi:CysZ protein